jgi:hypothetical protein
VAFSGSHLMVEGDYAFEQLLLAYASPVHQKGCCHEGGCHYHLRVNLGEGELLRETTGEGCQLHTI